MQLAEKSAYQTAVVEVIPFDVHDVVRTSGEVNVTDVGTTLDWVPENQFN